MGKQHCGGQGGGKWLIKKFSKPVNFTKVILKFDISIYLK